MSYDPGPKVYRYRRLIVAALNLITVAILATAMLVFLGANGLGATEWLMLGCFLLTLPYASVGFWNACLGLACRWLAVFQLPPDYNLDGSTPDAASAPLVTRTALVVTVRNESPGAVFQRLAAMRDTLVATGEAAAFVFVVLSDSDQESIIDSEARAFEAFAVIPFAGGAPIYRRRAVNNGYKAGNIGEFLDAEGDQFDYFVPLDADSFVSGPVLVRMARAMERHTQIGILQSLVVGMPTTAGFARIFQFGMRHAMRAFTVGAAWWTGDCGAYWGHNAIVRTAPFRDYCRMPRIPGRTPLSGAVMSHDQLEAAFMRRAGYEVRVAPVETESYEINPPNLLDFIKRELRWCQGNMQYLFFLGARGLKATSRAQLGLAMCMYIGPPAWIAMTIIACFGGLAGTLQVAGLVLGIGLFSAVLALAFAPKVMGVVDVALSPHARALYAGAGCFGLSVLIELLVSMVMAPIVAVSISLFLVGLLFNRRIGWVSHNRDVTTVAWRRAAVAMAVPTGFGLLLGLFVAWQAGFVELVIGMPFIAGLSLSIPFTVLSARAELGRYCAARGLFAVPEEREHSVSAIAAGVPPTIERMNTS